MITGMPRIAIATEHFDDIVATFRDQLGVPVIDISESSVQSLGARLAMCVPEGGSNIELMSPADPAAPLSQSLQKFLDRRGQGLFALMLEAPVPNEEAEQLMKRGLNVLPLMAGAGGRDVHPNSTHGVLIRVYPTSSFQGTSDQAQIGEGAATGLSGIARVVIAVRDIEHAVEVYGNQFAMETDEPVLDTERGVVSATCRPPAGGEIELVAVADESRPFGKSIAEFLEDGREGMYALVLQSADLASTADALAKRGLEARPAADSTDALEIDRDSVYGALIRIEAA